MEDKRKEKQWRRKGIEERDREGWGERARKRERENEKGTKMEVVRGRGGK